MVRIRLSRAGKKNSPIYSLVVQEQDFFRDGRFIEKIGHYNPDKAQKKLVIKSERYEYWLKQGAQPTVTVKSLLRRLSK